MAYFLGAGTESGARANAAALNHSTRNANDSMAMAGQYHLQRKRLEAEQNMRMNEIGFKREQSEADRIFTSQRDQAGYAAQKDRDATGYEHSGALARIAGERQDKQFSATEQRMSSTQQADIQHNARLSDIQESFNKGQITQRDKELQVTQANAEREFNLKENDRAFDPARAMNKIKTTAINGLMGGAQQPQPAPAETSSYFAQFAPAAPVPPGSAVANLVQAPYMETADAANTPSAAPQEGGAIGRLAKAADPMEKYSTLIRVLNGINSGKSPSQQASEEQDAEARRMMDRDRAKWQFDQDKHKAEGKLAPDELRKEKLGAIDMLYKTHIEQAMQSGDQARVQQLQLQYMNSREQALKGDAGPVAIPTIQSDEFRADPAAAKIEALAQKTGYTHSRDAFEKALEATGKRNQPGIPGVDMAYRFMANRFEGARKNQRPTFIDYLMEKGWSRPAAEMLFDNNYKD